MNGINHINVLIMIVSCEKHKANWNDLLVRNPKAILFYGNPELEENYQYDAEKRILTLKCNDFYEGLPEKMIAMINAVLQLQVFSTITHIFKIDDNDMRMKTLNLEYINNIIMKNGNQNYMGFRVIYSNNNKPCRTWHFEKCSSGSYWEHNTYRGPYTNWSDGGKGYVLSRHSMDKICTTYNFKNMKFIKKYHIYEDVMIALILKTHNIYPVQLKN